MSKQDDVQPLGCSACAYWSPTHCAATGESVWESRYPGITKLQVANAAKKGVHLEACLPGPCGGDALLWAFQP